jgi:hypothetical protein
LSKILIPPISFLWKNSNCQRTKLLPLAVVGLAVVGLAVVGLIDQQPNLVVVLSIAEITLIQRFACWSKDQHGRILQLEIISSAAVVGLAVVVFINK